MGLKWQCQGAQHWSVWEMGRGEEEGGFFDCYLSRSSLSRHIRPQQQKTYTAQEKSAIFSAIFSLSVFFLFLHSSYFSLTSTVHRSNYVFFFIRVLQSFYSIVSFFLQFFFFLVLPTVEGPHSDTLSRTRFSVFLRILFGVSSSSSSKTAENEHACEMCATSSLAIG